MASFEYAGFTVRDEVKQLHRASWKTIARAGSHWEGAERVEIARQARAARAARGDPPWLRKNLADADGRLGEEAIDAARTIAADAHKIDAAWASRKIGALGDAAYVELGSVVVTVTAIDALGEALGTGHAPLPEAQPGKPDGARLDGVADAGAFVPMMDPFVGPNVARALSLVPEANRLFMQNVMAMYSGRGGGFFDMVWEGPLARPQAELLAARVSALNECFY